MLYLHGSLAATLALKLFRGEPAISTFDWAPHGEYQRQRNGCACRDIEAWDDATQIEDQQWPIV